MLLGLDPVDLWRPVVVSNGGTGLFFVIKKVPYSFSPSQSLLYPPTRGPSSEQIVSFFPLHEYPLPSSV